MDIYIIWQYRHLKESELYPWIWPLRNLLGHVNYVDAIRRNVRNIRHSFQSWDLQWHHIAVVWDGKKVTFYHDSQEVKVVDFSGTAPYICSHDNALYLRSWQRAISVVTTTHIYVVMTTVTTLPRFDVFVIVINTLKYILCHQTYLVRKKYKLTVTIYVRPIVAWSNDLWLGNDLLNTVRSN